MACQSTELRNRAQRLSREDRRVLCPCSAEINAERSSSRTAPALSSFRTCVCTGVRN